MQHQVLPGIVSQQVRDVVQFFPLRDLKYHLSLGSGLRLAVKPQAEGPVEQLGKSPRKVEILCNDANLGGTERIAVEQDTVGLRPGAAQFLHRQPAQFIFRIE